MLYNEKWDKPEIVAPKPLEPWQQLLLDAADLLEQKGWCRGAYETNEGRHCAVGAIIDVARPLTMMHPYRLTALHKLERFVGGTVTVWNDNQSSGQAVIDAMRKAAKG